MKNYVAQMMLKGKTAVVVGGCGLIGQASVQALAQAGAKVVIVDVNTTAATKLVASLKKLKLNVSFEYVDCTDIDQLQENIQRLVKKLKRIDVWVNTAYPRTEDWGASIETMTVKSWRTNVDMQLNAVALCCAYVAEAMKSKGGSIINLGSIYGTVGANFPLYENTVVKPVSMIYAAVKGGLVNLARAMASYWGKYNIRINTVCPGGVFDHQDPKFLAKYNQHVPLRRMAQPHEVASAILFLASDASAYITGTSLMVDGGWTAV